LDEGREEKRAQGRKFRSSITTVFSEKERCFSEGRLERVAFRRTHFLDEGREEKRAQGRKFHRHSFSEKERVAARMRIRALVDRYSQQLIFVTSAASEVVAIIH
jgi:hypothetical protein